jgi:hypothetical protein
MVHCFIELSGNWHAVLRASFRCSKVSSLGFTYVRSRSPYCLSWCCAASRRLLGAVVAALGAPHCGRAARDAALSVVESLLQHQEAAAAAVAVVEAAEAQEAGGGEEAAAFAAVLEPHATALLAALRSVVVAATGSGGKVCALQLILCWFVHLSGSSQNPNPLWS